MIYFKLKILIPWDATTSMGNRNRYDIKILWLLGLITDNWPGFSIHTVQELLY